MKLITPSSIVVLMLLLLPFILIAQDQQTTIPSEVDSFIQLSRNYTAKAEFDSAFIASASAGQLAQECCGENSAAYAGYCFNEGRIRYFMGQNKEAIPWYVRSKDIRAEVLGTSDPEYGKSLNNLAIAYKKLEQYEAAEPLYLAALAIREASSGRESITCSNVLDNLASLYYHLGNYETAEAMGIEAKDIREKILGNKHPYYGISLVNLASIYYSTNNVTQAEAYYLEAKNLIESQEDLNYYSYMSVLDNLGAVAYQKRKYAEAEQYYLQAAELRQEVYGQQSEESALSLNHLGVVYEKEGRLEAAAQAQRAALSIMDSLALGNHITYATYLQDLGDIYTKQGQTILGREQQQKALAILESKVGKNHPRYLRGLRELAVNEYILGNKNSAINALINLAKLEEKPLASAIRHLSREELANYTTDFEENLYFYFTLAENAPELVGLCYDKIMVYKGFLQHTALQFQQFAQNDPSTQDTYRQWRSLHRSLATNYASSANEQEELAELEEQAYQLEKELVRSGGALGSALQSINWQAVQDGLGDNDAAIEFVHYKSKQPDLSDIKRYAALLLLPKAEQPFFIPLCTATMLDSLLQNNGQDQQTFINAFYDAEALGGQLHQLLWQPIEQELNKHSQLNQIYYAATGLLHRINLAAIPGPTGRNLGQSYQLTALGSTRQLALPSSQNILPEAPTALLYGSIDYGKPERLELPSDESLPPTNSRSDFPPETYQNQRGYNAEDGHWQPLSWTEVEVLTANDLLTEAKYQPNLRTGAEATEASLKAAAEAKQSPYLLHLATHGFFFPAPAESGKLSGAQNDQLAFRSSKRAMIRSGLVLADGNYAWINGHPRETAVEDGILTAYEVSQLDLRQTELVVLSACETGLGDIRGTEGVYGLQRAFKLAGARYIIMTLWQVPDFETQAFMTTFYLAWLEEGKSIPEAFRVAQAYMKARYGDAFKWAGFVLVE